MPANPDRAPRDAAGQAPTIRAMTAAACVRLLETHVVGRLAFSFHDRVDITPFHYVYDAEWIFARTAPGSRMAIIRHSPWVAFEVDEVKGLFDWRSVVARGKLHTFDPDGSPADQARWDRGIALLRDLVPETDSADDPVPFRTIVFGIHIDSMTGRASSSRRRAR